MKEALEREMKQRCSPPEGLSESSRRSERQRRPPVGEVSDSHPEGVPVCARTELMSSRRLSGCRRSIRLRSGGLRPPATILQPFRPPERTIGRYDNLNLPFPLPLPHSPPARRLDLAISAAVKVLGRRMLCSGPSGSPSNARTSTPTPSRQ